MSKTPLMLKWEWPAGRTMEAKLLAQVKEIKKASKGLFGSAAAPSNANALPEATDIVMEVTSGPVDLAGKTVTLRVPGMEAAKLRSGMPAAFGLVQGNSTCICVAAAPAGDVAELEKWFSGWSCAAPK